MGKRARPALLLSLLLSLPLGLTAADTASAVELSAEQKGVGLLGGPVTLEITLADVPPGQQPVIEIFDQTTALETLRLGPGTHTVKLKALEVATSEPLIFLRTAGDETAVRLRLLPGWISIIPPLVAIGLALIFKDVLVSLFLGVFVGALALTGWNPFAAFASTLGNFVVPAITDTGSGHAQIIVFSMLLGGMVGVINKSGGTRGIVERLAPYATDPRSGQLATWLMGIVIFFDDYANTLIVGSTMRPVTDRLKISREKLAYIVDSTAAPVASVVPISTWIGFEIGLIATALTDLNLPGEPYNAFNVFIASIPYRFYPLFALVLGFTIAATRKDFGPMLVAERRAARDGHLLAPGDTALADYQSRDLEPPEGTPHRAINAVIPILAVIGVTIYGLIHTGIAALDQGAAELDFFPWLRAVFSSGDSYSALLWASLTGVALGVLLPITQRLLTLRDAMTGVVEGFKAMLLAMVVLVLAWSIGAVCGELHTADWLVGVTDGVLSPHWLPALVFILSAFVAFATGTSWGAMGILMPLVIPLVHGIATQGGYAPGDPLYTTFLVGTVSSVLAGTVWGDHCSPISDTTILSSMASGSDHIAHVRTQLPYALAMGMLGVLVGDIPTAYGLPVWVSLLVGSAVIVGGVMWLGKRPQEA